jgi:serine/threonine protein kinase
MVPDQEQYSIFSGLSVKNGRYLIKRVLKNTLETKMLVALARDTHAAGQLVVLKRWPCLDPAREARRYETVSAPLLALRHPLVPRVLDHFVEDHNYYHIQTYIDGESLEERLQRLLAPLPERSVLIFMNVVLNILVALEQQMPPGSYHFCSITPTNILLDLTRERAFLTGFQLPSRPTRKLAASSPYIPRESGIYDQRTLMYSLAACAHYALSSIERPVGVVHRAIQSLNAAVSPACDALLQRALHEQSHLRYQRYQEMQEDVKHILGV